MFGWIVSFFVLTIVSGFLGLTGLSGLDAQIAKILTVLFALMFLASIFYSAIVGHNPRLRMRTPVP